MGFFNGKNLHYTNTKFPTNTDASTHPDMTSVTASMLGDMYSYQKLWAQGDYEKAKTFLANHSELKNALWDADKYNWLKDAIVGLQSFIINDLGNFVANLQAERAGLQTEASDFSNYRVNSDLFPESSNDGMSRAYSSDVMDAILADMLEKVLIEIPDLWEYNENIGLWTVTVANEKIVKEKDYEKYLCLVGLTNIEAITQYNRKVGCIISGKSFDGAVTFYSTENIGAINLYLREV